MAVSSVYKYIWNNWDSVHCWWEYRIVQLLFKTIWKFLTKLNLWLHCAPLCSLLLVLCHQITWQTQFKDRKLIWTHRFKGRVQPITSGKAWQKKMLWHGLMAGTAAEFVPMARQEAEKVQAGTVQRLPQETWFHHSEPPSKDSSPSPKEPSIRGTWAHRKHFEFKASFPCTLPMYGEIETWAW